jgi:glycosyltransferase involved in cell wall biosynthesis
MRIGISGTFWPAFTAGSGQHIRGLLPALVNAGTDEFYLYIPRFALPASFALDDIPVHARVVSTPFDQRNPNLAKLWYEQIALPQVSRRDGIQVLHIPYMGAPLVHSIPVIVTVHDLIPMLLPEYRASASVRAYTSLAARATQRAQFVITVSQSAAHDVKRVLRIPEQRIRVIYNAVSGLHRPVDGDQYSLTAQRLKLPPRYLLYLGGFDRRKNVPELVLAYQMIYRQVPDITLVIAGRLPHQDSEFAPDPHKLVDELQRSYRADFSIALRRLWFAGTRVVGVRYPGCPLHRQFTGRGGRSRCAVCAAG